MHNVFRSYTVHSMSIVDRRLIWWENALFWRKIKKNFTVGNRYFQILISEASVRLQQSTIQTNEENSPVNLVVLLTGTLDVPVTVK